MTSELFSGSYDIKQFAFGSFKNIQDLERNGYQDNILLQ